MSTPPTPPPANGAGGISHTGDPSQVTVTVPPGAPAVSAPRVADPGPAPAPAPGAEAKAAPRPTHQGDPATLRSQAAHVEQLHDEVMELDVLMELHAQQKRTQQMLLALALIVTGAVIVTTIGRARTQLLEDDGE